MRALGADAVEHPCGGCGQTAGMHIEGVSIVTRPDEYDDALASMSVYPLEGQPPEGEDYFEGHAGRRVSVVVAMFCEMCSARTKSALVSHKGTVRQRAFRSVADQPDEQDS